MEWKYTLHNTVGREVENEIEKNEAPLIDRSFVFLRTQDAGHIEQIFDELGSLISQYREDAP